MFLLDIDGVCMNMLGALKKRNPAFIPEGVIKYNFTGDIGIERAEVFRYLKEKKTFMLQEPYEGVKEDIAFLLSVCNDVRAYTSVPESCVNIRFKQLVNLGLSVGLIYREDKPVVRGVDAILDDNPAELLKYADTDSLLFLMDNYYNQEVHNDYDFSKFIRVKTVREAAEIYAEHYKS